MMRVSLANVVTCLSDCRNKGVYVSVFLVSSLVGLSYYIHFFIVNGYLPSPFLYDKSDTFMDFFAPLHWAYDDGRYTDWQAVYPPLNFWFLKFVHFVCGGEYGAPRFMRDNSPFVIAGLCCCFLVVPAFMLGTRLWQDFLNREKILLYFAIVLSSPMLFVLERGNLILFTFLFLPFVLTKTGLARDICLAMLINIKPYFALLMIYYMVRRNWKGLTICLILSGFVFLIPGIALDDHFFLFFKNIVNFSHKDSVFSLREVMAFPSTVSVFSYVLKSTAGAIFVSKYLSREMISIVVYVIESIKWLLLAIAIVSLFIKSSSCNDDEIFSLLIAIVTNFGIWVGGYTIILYIVLFPVLINMRVSRIYVSLFLLMVMPLDIISLFGESIGLQYSYMSHSYVNIQWTLGLGSGVRPFLNMIFLLVLSCEIFLRRDSRVPPATLCSFRAAAPALTGQR